MNNTSPIVRFRYGPIIVFSIIILSLSAIGVFGVPFRFADGNSGRYLPNLYRAMDPTLFPNDPVADGFTRFQSIFYPGLGRILHDLGFQPLGLEPVFRWLWILTSIILLCLVSLAGKYLETGWWGFLWMGAWMIQEKGAPVGGDSFFSPSLTHATIAVILCIAALLFLFQGNRIAYWLLLGITVFFHSIYALQFAIFTFPVLVRKEGITRAEVIGWFAFSLCMLYYLGELAPAPFTSEEVRVFLAAKGHMVHVSPFSQPWTGWLGMFGLISLAGLAYHQYLAGRRPFDLLAGFMLSGALVSLGLSMLAITTGIVQFVQLQPLRIFTWVNLFAMVLLISAGLTLVKADRLVGLFLLSIVMLDILDSLWSLPCLYFGMFYFLVLFLEGRDLIPWKMTSGTILRWGIALLAGCSVVMWLFRDSHSFESFRDPLPVLVLLVLLLLTWMPVQRLNWNLGLFSGILIFSLIGRSVYMTRYISARQDTDFNLVCRWIALNTPKDARVITAVLDDSGGNFRARAIRTSVNEGQSALYWVVPFVAEKNAEDSRRVMDRWDGNHWDLDALFPLAKEWNAGYILIEGAYLGQSHVLYQLGDYTVVNVP